MSGDCGNGACVAGVCESVGLGSGTVVTFGHNSSDYNGVVDDTHIDARFPDTEYENYGYLWVGGTPQSTIVCLIHFDLSALAPGLTITGVQLKLDVSMNPSTMGSVTVHELLEARTEWETTWNERTLGVAWTTPGCGIGSRSADVLGRFQPYMNQVYDIPLPASVVQRWVDDPSTNHGFALVGDDSDFADFRPSGVGSGVKPQLTITYE